MLGWSLGNGSLCPAVPRSHLLLPSKGAPTSDLKQHALSSFMVSEAWDSEAARPSHPSWGCVVWPGRESPGSPPTRAWCRHGKDSSSCGQEEWGALRAHYISMWSLHHGGFAVVRTPKAGVLRDREGLSQVEAISLSTTCSWKSCCISATGCGSRQ